MRKIIFLVLLFICSTLAVFAQESIRVKYQGAQPTISDFAWAFLSSNDDDEEEDCVDESFNAIRAAWDTHSKGLPQEEGVTLTIDQKNGFVVYEYKSEYEDVKHLLRIEMCYWNESDGKHKLFAYNVCCFRNGECSPGQFDGLLFYRYDNATKKMTLCNDVGFDVEFGTNDGDDVAYISYALPRTGKDIILTTWYKRGKQQKTLRWNGRRFTM